MKQSRLAAWPFVAVALIVGYAYLWTVTSNHVAFELRAGQRDYYNLLVHGFLKGKLGLDVDVPQPLLDCADPYDPAQRPPGVTLHDASLYRGKYYIYYGVVPAVSVLLPFRLITGLDLPLAVAVLGFSLGQFVVILLLLSDIRRRFFPGCPTIMAALLAGGAGFASWAPVLLRRSSMYELPIAAGSFFAVAALACMYRAWVSGRVRWVVAASAAWGLAVGSRPIHVLAAMVVVLLPWLYSHVATRPLRRRTLWCAALVPIATIGLLLAAYNYARFGDPTEFGLRYILSGVYEAKIQHFEPRYVVPNVRAYFGAATTWGRYFPFLHEVGIGGTQPAQYSATDHPFGLLAHVPLLWLGVFAVCRRNGTVATPAADVYRRFVFAVAGTVIATAGLLVFFYAAAARYIGDFAPMLALLGAIGGLAASERAVRSTSAAARVGGPVLIVGAALLSMGTVFLFSVQLYGQLRSVNPRAYARLERVTNRPVHWVERLLGGGSRGAWILQAQLPASASPGRVEELVRTGWGGAYDRVVLEYPGPGRVVFQYEHTGAPVVRSDDVAFDASQPHAITILMGPLMPPPSWPGYSTWPEAEVVAAQRHVQVGFDGRVMLERYQRFYAGGVDSLVVGGKGTDHPFGGRIVSLTREPIQTTRSRLAAATHTPPSLFAPDRHGMWHLAVQFPERRPPGVREPLVVSGETGRGDFVAVEYLRDQRVMFLFDHWGKGALLSPSFPCEPGREYQIEVSHSGYVADARAEPIRAGELTIRLDGREFWHVLTPLYPADPLDCYVGSNPIGGASCDQLFSGRIRPLPLGP